jgi:CPA2 family monovalent cation:H+ antiporter-2
VEATILDNDSDRVDLLRRMGFKVFYGDATRHDLLESAGAARAKILISAVDGLEPAHRLVETAKRHFPHLMVLVRARHRADAYELMDMGVTGVYREHLDTSIRLGVDVLRQLGHRGYTAYRAGQQFRRYDEAAMANLLSTRHDLSTYISTVRAQIAQQEALLMSDRQFVPSAGDHAWDSEKMRRPRGS